MEEILIALGEAVVPLIRDALTKGAAHADIMKTLEASMVAASDAEMLRELGPDKP
jgi:hypothetical protein